MTPATAEEIEAANNSDPLTKANFWANEYTKRPEDLDVALTFVSALRGIGSNERAIEVLSQSLIVHPGNPDVLMTLGRVFSADNNLMGAARAFEKAAIVAPDRAEAWSAFGITLDKMERHDMAQAAYDKALALEPTRTATLANYGLSLALQGDLPGAEAKLRLAAEQPGADLRVTENLALILGLQGRYDEMAAVSSRFAPESVVKKNTALLQQMIQPVRSWEALEEALLPPAEEAEFFVDPLLDEDPEMLEAIHAILKETSDLERIVARISTGKANPRDVINAGHTLSKIPLIHDRIKKGSLALGI